MLIGPIVKTASDQILEESNGLTSGIIISLTKELIKEVEAEPIMNAKAKEIILYSFKNSLNSFRIIEIKLKLIIKNIFKYLINYPLIITHLRQ